MSSDWRTIVADLKLFASQPTAAPQVLAAKLGYDLPHDTPEPVAAELLRRQVSDALLLQESSSASDGQIEYLADLADETGSAEPEHEYDRRLADAWISVMHARRAVDHLERLRPEPGDIVEIRSHPDPDKAEDHEFREISSIGSDGQLFFRGRGLRARPHAVQMVARKAGEDYDGAQYRARQRAALLVNNPEALVIGRLDELARWKVEGEPTSASVLAFEDALNSARNERPMQKVLEQHPEMLDYLVSGHGGIYVIPQVQLGKDYVPDFLVAAYTSLGLHWTLVELESPTAVLTIKDGQPAQQLRKAMQQIADWREWLMNNVNYARRPTAENGLGLPGIRIDARGLIIIGRGRLSTHSDAMRMREQSQRNVEIRTYDWLIRAARARRGLPAGVLDAEVIRREGDRDDSW
jgi:Domain of unknown function (DUF4263)